MMRRTQVRVLFSLLSLLAVPAYAHTGPSIELHPEEWKFGMIGKGESVETMVQVKNLTNTEIKVSFIPACSCLRVSPTSCIIGGGDSVGLSLAYDSTDDEGKVVKYFIVNTDPPSEKQIFYILRGVVRADSSPTSSMGGPRTVAASAPQLELRYYYTPGCRSCEYFLVSGLPNLESRYGVVCTIERRDLLDSASYEELADFAASIGTSIRAIPALRVGGVLFQGEKEIEDGLTKLFAAAAAGGKSGAEPSGAPLSPGTKAARLRVEGLSALAVAVAGLVDGVNPCAFATLLFLLSSLALAGRGRREVLTIGLVFSLGVFLTYLGAGFGLFAAFRAARAAPLVSAILRWILVAVLCLLAVLSLIDYRKIKAGRPGEMILQLPNSLKLKIHSAIRVRATTAALAISSLTLGFLVSIFEFACTGQVYLPTLAYLARGPGGTEAAFLLVLYNLCFIAPLLAIFGAAYFGVGSKRLTSIFQRHMGATKIALAVVFAGLACMTALT